MRRIACCFVFLSSLFLVNSAYSEDNPHGDCDYKNQNFSSLFCLGPANLSDTSVKGEVSVAGPLLADRTNFNSMEVGGVANVSNTNVKANVSVLGNLSSTHGNFTGNVLITSSKMTFNASLVKGSLTVKSPEKNPVLELYCATHVLGDVIFQGEPGLIKKSADSTINGKVVNAKVEVVKSTEECK